jgi:hypothetical protein
MLTMEHRLPVPSETCQPAYLWIIIYFDYATDEAARHVHGAATSKCEVSHAGRTLCRDPQDRHCMNEIQTLSRHAKGKLMPVDHA